jgi:cell division protein FtsI (penicillin-binding protein 3)
MTNRPTTVSTSANLTFSVGRSALVLVVLGLLLSGMIGRVAYLQTYGREKTIRSAERQQHQVETLYARRGTIYDATGTLMAGTVQNMDLFVDPKFLSDYFTADDKSYDEYIKAVEKLSKIIEKPTAELSNLLSEKSETRYLKVAERLDETTVLAVKQLNLPGIGFTPSDERFYPMGSIGAHMLGGVGKDGHGLDGLELQFDKELAGHDGWKRTLKDARRNPIAVDADDYRPAEHGRHLILTIDANMQMIAEQELTNTCEQFHAKRGEVVLIDPRTGDVLAIANWPTFNPQNIDDSTKEERTNSVLVSPYEPGSTIKPFIAGPALMWHITRPDEIFHTGGAHWLTPYGRRISDVHNGYPQLAFWDVLVKSSNICMSMLGERMGNEKLWTALTSFHFGQRTGIELPGESGGRVYPLAHWKRDSTESAAQGYELMVTPLQLARGFCAYANGGKLVQPRLIKGFLDSEGAVVERRKPTDFNMLPQVIDPQTAKLVRRILCDVPVRGTAMRARSKTWNLFGKTGTAHISMGPGKGYSPTLFNSSFIAGCPAEDPKLVCAFIIHQPHAEMSSDETIRAMGHYGGAIAAPGASRMLERCMAYMNVPESPDLPLPPTNLQTILWEFNAKSYLRTATASRD